MHIAIDARFWGLQNTGLGRYTINLITQILSLDSVHRYTLITHPDAKPKIISQLKQTKAINAHINYLDATARHYSFKEQIQMPQLLYQLKPDLLHVPHFNIPIAWRGKLVVTIHDLIKQASVGSQTTTLPLPVYWTKYYVHNWVVSQAVYRASAILTPSKFTKDQIIATYQTDQAKIHVTPEAPDSIYFKNSKQKFDKLKYGLDRPYLVYTGNLYPHKNIPRLIYAIKNHNRVSKPSIQLALVCARNIFQEQLKNFIQEIDMQDTVKFLGYQTDQQLSLIYRDALGFITPSLIEGFGLPGLEAMAAQTPILSSNSTCLPEIYQDHAIYFDPTSQAQINHAISQLINLSPNERKSIITNAQKHARTFSWIKMAKQTLQVYNSLN